MKDNAIVSNNGSLPDDNSHTMVDHESLADGRTWMNLNASRPSRNLGH
jgi:hypothetical protein